MFVDRIWVFKTENIRIMGQKAQTQKCFADMLPNWSNLLHRDAGNLGIFEYHDL